MRLLLPCVRRLPFEFDSGQHKWTLASGNRCTDYLWLVSSVRSASPNVGYPSIAEIPVPKVGFRGKPDESQKVSFRRP